MLIAELLAEHRHYPIAVRQFGQGASEAADQRGITIIIDVFRASSTILALLEAKAQRVVPIELISDLEQYPDFVTVGEESGKSSNSFEFDNSPILVEENHEYFAGKNVVIRTTNGTRGIINAIGSDLIIVGCMRNMSAVVRFLVPHALNKVPISFVAMGSKEIPRIEDIYCAKIMYYQLLARLDSSREFTREYNSQENPINRRWINEIIEERVKNGSHNYKAEDQLYSLEIDISTNVPYYDQKNNSLRLQ